MSRFAGMLALAAVLASCGGRQEAAAEPVAKDSAPAAQASAAGPDLAACPAGAPLDSELLERTGPLPVPAPFEGLMKASPGSFAVSTLTGKTVCVDTAWMATTEEEKLSPDGRFLAFAWLGYEEFGYVVVDRTGDGQVIDTGNAPLAPPSGMRFASIDLSESGFGSLNAFAVWDIKPVGLERVGFTTDGLPNGDWRIEGWQDDVCVALSLMPSERYPENWSDIDAVPRDPWFASERNKWVPKAGRCPKS